MSSESAIAFKAEDVREAFSEAGITPNGELRREGRFGEHWTWGDFTIQLVSGMVSSQWLWRIWWRGALGAQSVDLTTACVDFAAAVNQDVLPALRRAFTPADGLAHPVPWHATQQEPNQ